MKSNELSLKYDLRRFGTLEEQRKEEAQFFSARPEPQEAINFYIGNQVPITPYLTKLILTYKQENSTWPSVSWATSQIFELPINELKKCGKAMWNLTERDHNRPFEDWMFDAQEKYANFFVDQISEMKALVNKDGVLGRLSNIVDHHGIDVNLLPLNMGETITLDGSNH